VRVTGSDCWSFLWAREAPYPRRQRRHGVHINANRVVTPSLAKRGRAWEGAAAETLKIEFARCSRTPRTKISH
jgi:hypothetical protein